MKGCRQIDARGIWAREAKAIEQFARAFAFDCSGCDDIFRRAYGWTPAALKQAKEIAFTPQD